MHFQHRKSPKEHVKEHVFFFGGGGNSGGGGGGGVATSEIL